MAVLSCDFNAGKARGVTWNLLNSFQMYLGGKQTALAPPGQEIQDRVLFRFSSQPSVSILKLAVKVFVLMDKKMRYREALVRMCQDGNFKTACDTAVALQLFDQFSVHIFCLPLLLMDKPSTMDSYLDQSPTAVKELVSYLDDISEDNIQKVSDLVSKYPMIKPVGVSKLSYKPLDRMIKKMVDKWSLSPTLYPITSTRWAKADLYYWVKQMFSLDSEQTSLQLVNWRELMERKVKDRKEMQELLVNTLFSFDIEEAKHWSSKYELGYFKDQPEVEEIDWGENVMEEAEQVEYYQLTMSKDKIMFVDTRQQFMHFLAVISEPALTVVGLDAEFMSSHSDQRISLLQVSTDKEAFLLDFEVLPSCLEEEDYTLLATGLFARPGLVIVGYGIVGDIKLLARSFTKLANLVAIAKSVLDLEMIKSKLSQLVSLPTTTVRGLSGLCHSVLGLPLSKSDQISDWSRRPLRQSQLTYAALDAFVCLEIYHSMITRAEERGVTKELKEMLENSMRKTLKDKEPKSKDKVTRVKLEEIVADLVAPLLSTPSPPQAMQLVCDDMLQGLCRRLRLFGVDCLALDNGQDHLDCVGLATQPEPRYVLSRGGAAAKIAKRLPAGHTLDIKSNDLDVQVEEVFRYFNIVAETGDLFSRCVLCNGGHYYLLDRGVLVQLADRADARQNRLNRDIRVEQEEEERREAEDLDLDRFNEDFESDSDDEPSFVSNYVRTEMVEQKRWESVQVTSSYTGMDRVGKVNLFTGETEEGVFVQVECVARTTMEKYEQFWICGKCGRVYFEGSHWGKAVEKVKAAIKVAPQPNPQPKL
eukprot:GFUD01001379.1.p1 GENE.GFUD01001379.1~~GFUD01001379.1.p1  ORF type:complete len:908 (+),score=346.11 GFUD01001379.1:285-2726(+)